MTTFIIIAIVALVIGYFYYKNKNQTGNNNQKIKDESRTYTKRSIVSNSEMKYLNIIRNKFGRDYIIQAQIPLSQIVNKKKQFDGQWASELNRQIDIGIFDHNYSPVLMIEINDSSHFRQDRRQRDEKVKAILEDAGIPLLTLWLKDNDSENNIIRKIQNKL